MSAHKDRPARQERRRYYRIDDVVHLEYRVVGPEERARILQGSAPKPPEDGLSEQLASLTKQMTPLLRELRREQPNLAKYLSALNKKIDLVATHLALQQARHESEREPLVAGLRRVNLSAGGIAFASPRPLRPDDYLHVRLGVEDTGFLINTYGRVIDCHPRQEKQGYQIRVEFPFLDEEERSLLMRHIFDRQRALIRERKQRRGKK